MQVGSYLRNVRESRHLSVAEVARRTKIHPSLIYELERNDLTHWPIHRIYRHGHLRSYAIALGLDPVKVLRQFDEEVGDPHPAPFQGPPRPARQRKAAATRPPADIINSGVVVSSAIAVGVILAVLFYEPKNNIAATSQQQVTDRATPATPATPASTVRAARPIETAVPQAAPGRDIELAAAPLEPVALVAPATPPLMEDPDVEGELRIATVPAQAHVTVNGLSRGETPVRVRFLPPGTYAIRAIEPGYRAAETVVTISAEQPIRNVRLVLRETAASNAPVASALGSTR